MKNHFDHIENYDAEIPIHIRNHLAHRKTTLILEEIKKKHGKKSVVILDAGCGTGWHSKILSERGHDVYGLDLSKNQIYLAKQNSPTSKFAIGNILSLPFQDNTFDISFTINTIHHLSSWKEQKKALAELARVTKKNGLIIVHEMNTKNPIIKFYLNYIFPKVRKIDEGHEKWITSESWYKYINYDVKKLVYYTFIPDFTPKFLLPVMKLVDNILENTPIRSWSAHYMVVLKNLKPKKD